MPGWILDTTELSLAFGDRQLLNTDRLTVFEGDRIGLIGENGAGKTTLIRILSGEILPDSGTVRCLVPVAVIHQQGNAESGEDLQISSLFRAKGDRSGLSGGEMTRNRISGALSRRQPGPLETGQRAYHHRAGGRFEADGLRYADGSADRRHRQRAQL